MHEGNENFNAQDEHENPVGEISYEMNGQHMTQEELGQFSPDDKTEYALTLGAGAFPMDGRLRKASTLEDYKQITADLEVFHVAQVEALEGGEPATTADVEMVEFAQMIEAYKQEERGHEEPARELATADDATAYLRELGLFEGLSKKGRQLIAVAFSATALAAAMPAEAQGWGDFGGQVVQYATQRVVQEAQIGVQTHAQLEQLRMSCDQALQSMESNLQFQIGNLQMQFGVNLSGIDLLGPNAVQQFQENNPHPTPQQIAAFNQARQITQQTSMQAGQTVGQCNMRMQQISQGAAYSRTMRVLGDVGNVVVPVMVGR